MKTSNGKYTDNEAKRCVEMGVLFGKDLDNVLTSVGVVSFGDTWSRRNSLKKRQREDVRRFVKNIDLTDCSPVSLGDITVA
ncbi:hypothetical protein ABVT39_023967 [Epinephelus coioides]